MHSTFINLYKGYDYLCSVCNYLIKKTRKLQPQNKMEQKPKF